MFLYLSRCFYILFILCIFIHIYLQFQNANYAARDAKKISSKEFRARLQSKQIRAFWMNGGTYVSMKRDLTVISKNCVDRVTVAQWSLRAENYDKGAIQVKKRNRDNESEGQMNC